ncbi:hypothetical protein JTE90_002419 [Oedothorax gibbosus]|uniref:Uncharacterized protein n=1 Tax=Oedothorax gibbosus TaxID=931172 RepID=A0AAV6UUL3_9ARAC|nr:hypothetical protein JTE90_002419 [Oedothorax gibbosus]
MVEDITKAQEFLEVSSSHKTILHQCNGFSTEYTNKPHIQMELLGQYNSISLFPHPKPLAMQITNAPITTEAYNSPHNDSFDWNFPSASAAAAGEIEQRETPSVPFDR